MAGQLWMVHLKDLTLNTSGIGPLYHSTHDKKFKHGSIIYRRGGQIWPVVFGPSLNDPSPIRTEDTIICSFEHCGLCTTNPEVYEGDGYPFVHMGRDTNFPPAPGRVTMFAAANAGAGGIDLTVDDIPIGETQLIFMMDYPDERIFEVEVRGCIPEVCRVCGFLGYGSGPAVLARDWFARLESDRAPAARPLTPPNNGPPRPVSHASSPDPNDVHTGLPPPAVEAGALRMVHEIHLEWEPDHIQFTKERLPHQKMVDEYFVDKSSDIFERGGSVQRVTFPDFVRDVMVCTWQTCEVCNEEPETYESSSNGFPWVHRRHVKGPRNAWRPGNFAKYPMLPDLGILESNVVELDGYPDGVRKTTDCWICVEGTCIECDQGVNQDGEAINDCIDADAEDGDGDVGMEDDDGTEDDLMDEGGDDGYFFEDLETGEDVYWSHGVPTYGLSSRDV